MNLTNFSKPKMTIALRVSVVWSVLFFFVSGCSSSDIGATLPGAEQDTKPPSLITVIPNLNDGEMVETNSVFQFNFSERLDISSLTSGLKLYTRKLRNIFESASPSADFIISDLDTRERLVETEDRLITVIDRVVLGEEVDDDGVVTEITTNVESEVFATRVNVSSDNGRFALASIYSIVFERSVKDTSSAASVDPTTGALSQGNFLNSTIRYNFSTDDGELQPSSMINTPFHSGSNFVGSIRFESLPDRGYMLWEQLFEETPGNSISGLLYKSFNYGTQEFSQTYGRLDYISSIDAGTSGVENNVLEFASDTQNSVACAVWSNQDNNIAPFQQSIMVRCGDGADWAPRLILNSHEFGPSVLSLKVLMLSETSAVVSYVYDGVQYIYKLLVGEGASSVTVQDSTTFGSATLSVQGVALDNANKANGVEAAVAMVSLVDSSAPASERYRLVSNTLVLDSGVIDLTSTTVETGASIYNQITIGFDLLGTGFSGWLQGTGNDRRLFTSRFSGQFWQTPVGVVKDGRGPITEGGVHVFDDGQSAFYWVQDIGTERQLKVQGAFAVDGGASLARPSPQIVDSNSGSFSSLNFSGDREGNGLLYYGLQGTSFYSVRFLHNTSWDDAWGDPELVASSVKTDNISVGQVLNDGRMILAYPNTSATYDALEARAYSDYE